MKIKRTLLLVTNASQKNSEEFKNYFYQTTSITRKAALFFTEQQKGDSKEQRKNIYNFSKKNISLISTEK